jgi:hypothetical protein
MVRRRRKRKQRGGLLGLTLAGLGTLAAKSLASSGASYLGKKLVTAVKDGWAIDSRNRAHDRQLRNLRGRMFQYVKRARKHNSRKSN